MIYTFVGGSELFMVKVDDKKNIYLNSTSTNRQFKDIRLLLFMKYGFVEGAQKHKELKDKIATLNDDEMNDYIVKEFTTGNYAGYSLKWVEK